MLQRELVRLQKELAAVADKLAVSEADRTRSYLGETARLLADSIRLRVELQQRPVAVLERQVLVEIDRLEAQRTNTYLECLKPLYEKKMVSEQELNNARSYRDEAAKRLAENLKVLAEARRAGQRRGAAGRDPQAGGFSGGGHRQGARSDYGGGGGAAGTHCRAGGRNRPAGDPCADARRDHGHSPLAGRERPRRRADRDPGRAAGPLHRELPAPGAARRAAGGHARGRADAGGGGPSGAVGGGAHRAADRRDPAAPVPRCEGSGRGLPVRIALPEPFSGRPGELFEVTFKTRTRPRGSKWFVVSSPWQPTTDHSERVCGSGGSGPGGTGTTRAGGGLPAPSSCESRAFQQDLQPCPQPLVLIAAAPGH